MMSKSIAPGRFALLIGGLFAGVLLAAGALGVAACASFGAKSLPPPAAPAAASRRDAGAPRPHLQADAAGARRRARHSADRRLHRRRR